MNNAERKDRLFGIKLITFIFLGIIAFTVMLRIISGIVSYVRGSDSRKVKEIFESDNYYSIGSEPEIRGPFTCYSLNAEGTWEAEEITEPKGFTSKISECETCVCFWADIEDDKIDKEYKWSNGKEAYSCPVYMTVIDLKNNKRYNKVEVGKTHLDYENEGAYRGFSHSVISEAVSRYIEK